jgi:hypothetical protein
MAPEIIFFVSWEVEVGDFEALLPLHVRSPFGFGCFRDFVIRWENVAVSHEVAKGAESDLPSFRCECGFAASDLSFPPYFARIRFKALFHFLGCQMGQLLAKCFGCGAVYPSGIVTDMEMVERDLKAITEITTHCPYCGKENLTAPGKMAFTTAILPA